MHHELSSNSNIFCEKVLCDMGVVKQLDEHCVLWVWDVTDVGNRKALHASLARPCEYLLAHTGSLELPRSADRSTSMSPAASLTS